MVSARKGRDKHDEGRLGKVEVGDEAVDGLILEARIDEELGVSGAFLELSKALVDGFQSPCGGRTDGDDASMFLLGLVESVAGLFGHHIEFRMHVMLSDVIVLDRTEGSQADMKGDVDDFDTFGPEPIKELWREVEAGCRSSGASFDLGIDRLIA